MKQFSIVVVLLLMSVSAAHGYTLEELLAASVANRDLIKTYQARVEISKEDITHARGEFLPSLDMDYTVNRLDESTDYEHERNNTFSSSLTWNLFSGFKDKYGLDYQLRIREMESYYLDSIRQDIQLRVALAYLQLNRQNARLRVTEDAYRLYQDRYEEVLLKEKVGLLKRNDVLKIKVELDNAYQDRQQAQAEVRKSLNDLRRETRLDIRPGGVDFGYLETPRPALDTVDLETVLLERRSDLRALRKYREATALQIKAARASYYPRVDAALIYKDYQDDYLPGSGDDHDEEVRGQLTVSLNLFDGLKKKTRVIRAKLDNDIAGYDLAEHEQDLKTALKNVLLDLQVARENLQVAQSSRGEADEHLRVTDLTFQQGLATPTDLLDAIYYLSRAKFNVIEAETAVHENDFRLMRLTEAFGRASL